MTRDDEGTILNGALPGETQIPVSQYYVTALARGLKVLSALGRINGPATLADIAAEVALPKPTVFRALRTLEAEGYVDAVDGHKFRPGPKVLLLGYATLNSLSLVETSAPLLERHSRDTGAVLSLSVLVGAEVVGLYRAHPPGLSLRINLPIGSSLPAAVTSGGKALLADLDDDTVLDLIGGTSFWEGRGRKAHRSVELLLQDLAVIRKRGWAMQDEELADGTRAIAAVVRRQSGEAVGSVSWSFNFSEPIEDTLEQHVADLLETAEAISERMS